MERISLQGDSDCLGERYTVIHTLLAPHVRPARRSTRLTLSVAIAATTVLAASVLPVAAQGVGNPPVQPPPTIRPLETLPPVRPSILNPPAPNPAQLNPPVPGLPQLSPPPAPAGVPINPAPAPAAQPPAPVATPQPPTGPTAPAQVPSGPPAPSGPVGPSGAGVTTVSGPLVGTAWRLETIYTGITTPVIGGADTPTLIFGADGSVMGNGGCNPYQGRFGSDGIRLTFSQVNSTRRGCANAALNGQETRFLAVLNATASYRLGGGILTLQDGSGNRLADLRAGVAIVPPEPGSAVEEPEGSA